MECGSTAMAVDSTAVSATANSSTADDAATTRNSNAEDSTTANSNAEDSATANSNEEDSSTTNSNTEDSATTNYSRRLIRRWRIYSLAANSATTTLPGLFGENIGETLLLRHNVQILQRRRFNVKKCNHC